LKGKLKGNSIRSGRGTTRKESTAERGRDIVIMKKKRKKNIVVREVLKYVVTQ